MKRPFLVLLLFAGLGLNQCSEDSDPAQGEVIFSFDSPPITNGKKSSGIQDGSSIIITISRNGKRILDFHEIELLKFGEHFVSKPLRLPEGKYHIEDFLVVKDGEVRFGTPKEGSKLASLVDKKLPYTINVSHTHVNSVSMKVIDVTYEEPESLGYASFRMKVVLPFRVTVFVYEKGRLKRTHATLQLVRADSVIDNLRLFPRVNTLPFSGEQNVTYQLTVSKEGYRSKTVDFNYQAYQSENGNKALEFILEPVPEASFTATSDVQLYLTFTKSGSITIDWPDGTNEIIEFQATPSDPDKLSFAQLSHSLNDSEGVVGLSGDLDLIVEFVSVSSLSSLDISNLSNLQSLTLENSSMDRIDLRNTESISTLAFVNTNLGEILLPETHQINSVLIEGLADQVPSLPLDTLIDDIHANALKNSITEGAFIMFNGGEIQPSSLEKLTELQTSLEWYIEIE